MSTPPSTKPTDPLLLGWAEEIAEKDEDFARFYGFRPPGLTRRFGKRFEGSIPIPHSDLYRRKTPAAGFVEKWVTCLCPLPAEGDTTSPRHGPDCSMKIGDSMPKIDESKPSSPSPPSTSNANDGFVKPATPPPLCEMIEMKMLRCISERNEEKKKRKKKKKRWFTYEEKENVIPFVALEDDEDGIEWPPLPDSRFKRRI